MTWLLVSLIYICTIIVGSFSQYVDLLHLLMIAVDSMIAVDDSCILIIVSASVQGVYRCRAARHAPASSERGFEP